MIMESSPTRPSVQCDTFIHRGLVKYPSDRAVLTVVFVALFYLNYASSLIDAFANIFAVHDGLAHSRTVSGAEILGFVAIFVVLTDLKSERLLRWWDFLAIVCIVTASLYPSDVYRAISMTCLGLLFIATSDKRIASLGQLCIGLAWISFWGALVLDFIKQWLLPMEAGVAFLPLYLFGSFSLDGTIISNGNGHAIDVLEPCSAFRNTITMAFIWLSLIKILEAGIPIKVFQHYGGWPRRCRYLEHRPHQHHGSLGKPILLLAHGSRPMDSESADAERDAWPLLLRPCHSCCISADRRIFRQAAKLAPVAAFPSVCRCIHASKMGFEFTTRERRCLLVGVFDNERLGVSSTTRVAKLQLTCKPSKGRGLKGVRLIISDACAWSGRFPTANGA